LPGKRKAASSTRARPRTRRARASTRVNPRFARFRIAVRRSPIERYGLFAEDPIPAARTVIEYTGERVLRSDARRYTRRKRSYLAGLNARWAIDGAIGGSGAELVNHSCAPNLAMRRVRGHLLFVSLRAIAAGEELTVDYKFSSDDELEPCRCGAPTCRGTINLRP